MGVEFVQPHTLPWTMYDEHDLIDSPLTQTYTANGRSVEIQIYRMPDSGWTLEVVDQQNNSTVWDGEFATDQERSIQPWLTSKQKVLKPLLGVGPVNRSTEHGGHTKRQFGSVICAGGLLAA